MKSETIGSPKSGELRANHVYPDSWLDLRPASERVSARAAKSASSRVRVQSVKNVLFIKQLVRRPNSSHAEGTTTRMRPIPDLASKRLRMGAVLCQPHLPIPSGRLSMSTGSAMAHGHVVLSTVRLVLPGQADEHLGDFEIAFRAKNTTRKWRLKRLGPSCGMVLSKYGSQDA